MITLLHVQFLYIIFLSKQGISTYFLAIYFLIWNYFCKNNPWYLYVCVFQVVAIVSCSFVVVSTLCLIFSTLPRFQQKDSNGVVRKYLDRECLEKGSDNIGSAVCYTIYTSYLSLCTQTAVPITSEPFSRHHLYYNCCKLAEYYFYLFNSNYLIQGE